LRDRDRQSGPESGNTQECLHSHLGLKAEVVYRTKLVNDENIEGGVKMKSTWRAFGFYIGRELTTMAGSRGRLYSRGGLLGPCRARDFRVSTQITKMLFLTQCQDRLCERNDLLGEPSAFILEGSSRQWQEAGADCTAEAVF
jgi:hypothetical protein